MDLPLLSMRPAGDAGIVVDLEDRIDLTVNRHVHALAGRVREILGEDAVVEVIPGYANVLIRYDPRAMSYQEMVNIVGQAQREQVAHSPSRRFVLPVVYGGEFGSDLEEVARLHNMDPDEVIRRHSGRDYPIFCLGFSPGFPLLGGLDESLHTPRLETPRPRVPAGSVAIGGGQTGVYPTSTPGGWRLIGRTPLVLFDVRSTPPIPYVPGDVIRFQPVDAQEYERLRASRVMPEPQCVTPPLGA